MIKNISGVLMIATHGGHCTIVEFQAFLLKKKFQGFCQDSQE